MKGYSTNIESKTLENDHFRRVLHTGRHLQLVVMTLRPGEEIGAERHEHGDQFLRVESGEGKVVIDGVTHSLSDGFAAIIPARSEHNVVNTSASEPLRLYTLYSPPEHADGAVHKTKAEADAAHAQPRSA